MSPLLSAPMLFDSPVFFAFIILVVPLYWCLSWRQQNGLLLVASYFFYGWWDYRFLALILVSTIVDYWCARLIAGTDNTARRRSYLVISLVVNLTFLGFFKYYNFFAGSLAPALRGIGIQVSPPLLSILLPPGISFYTFQEVAYIVDVYFGRLLPATSLVDYALFISLFPHLIAGPIQRPSHLLPQVQNPRTVHSGRFFDGIMLILTGLFRKCVVADGCALIANAAFGGQLGAPSLAVVALGTYAFAWQIYGDFSGYSDIARGTAQLMGFHFMVNFRQPYLSESLQDFWRRWHISLSTWLRDYLYIPLGGNRRGEGRTYVNLAATMLLGGLWHGANWTFLVWGAIHGAGLALERFVRGALGLKDASGTSASPVRRWANRIVVFHVVCFAWIFFRADSVSAAFHFIGGLSHWEWKPQFGSAAIYLAFASLPLFFLDLVLEHRREEYPFARDAYPIRVSYAAAAVVWLLLFSANQASAFIYFQF